MLAHAWADGLKLQCLSWCLGRVASWGQGVRPALRNPQTGGALAQISKGGVYTPELARALGVAHALPSTTP